MPALLLRPPRARLCGAGREPHRVAVLGVAHDLARHRSLAAQGPAELADQACGASVVEMDMLADQRRALAVDAAVAVLLKGAEAVAQQQALELPPVDARASSSLGGRQSHLVTDFAIEAPPPAGVQSEVRRFVLVNLAIQNSATVACMRSLVMIATSFPQRQCPGAAPGRKGRSTAWSH